MYNSYCTSCLLSVTTHSVASNRFPSFRRYFNKLYYMDCVKKNLSYPESYIGFFSTMNDKKTAWI